MSSGGRIRADFAYVDARILVEGDGRDAHARMLAFGDDRVRDNEAAADGWLTLRYASEQMWRDPGVSAGQVHTTRRGRSRSRGA